ncbi:MAG: Na+/H+ antiporter NhaC family protein [Anaerovoracaceae bacterium]
MDLIIAFALFLAGMMLALFKGYSMIFPLLAGLAAFLCVGKHRSFSLRTLAGFGTAGMKDALIVIKVMCFIGFLTAVWRISGTITIFVYYGMKLITPQMFLLITFLLSCLLSYALGTSFGVAGTVGVIFMTLARSGGVDPVVTAGVIMSGVYFGDRGSPVSSSANMVAGVTGTDIFENVKRMMKSAALPLVLVLVIYCVFSFQNPLAAVDDAFLTEFEQTFTLSAWSFVPAVLMLVLPLLKVPVLTAMGLSILSGAAIAWAIGGFSLPEILKICLLGYHPASLGLVGLLEGGGLWSMAEIIVILLISSAYSGIFKGTAMLESLQEKLAAACVRIGRFPVMILMSLGVASVFCNQTISTLMCSNLLEKPYLDGGGSREELALDMENSVILLACFIPWTIGWTVPTSFFGVGAEAMPYAVYMYLVPLCWLLTKKRTFPQGKGDAK